MRVTTPEIFLVAKTELTVGLDKYLKSIGSPDWQPEEDASGGEILVEAAGRMCYRSWQPWDENKPDCSNPNVTRVREGNKTYLENILKSKHGSILEHVYLTFICKDVSRVFCYSEDTEVLTKEGWKLWPEVKGDEEFASLRDGQLVYEKAEEYFSEDYDGRMYHVRSEQIDLLVTDNHRMWVKRVDTQKAKRGEERFSIKFPEEIYNKRVRYQKGALWGGRSPEVISIPAIHREWVRSDSGAECSREYKGVDIAIEPFAEFLGYWLAEGHLGSGSDTAIYVTQNPGVDLDRIKFLIEEMGFKVQDVANGEVNRRIGFKEVSLYDWLKNNCGSVSYEKRIPLEALEWSPALLNLLLDGLIGGDGNIHKQNGHRVVYTTSKTMAGQIQEITLKVGIAANIRIDDRVGMKRKLKNGQVFHNQRVCYIVSLLSPSRLNPHVNHNLKSGYSNRWVFENGYNDQWENYQGKVYCVKVPSGLLHVRRNGKACWSGNTHELVRHRAGWAYSQESLRFVRLNDIKFWLPPELDKNEEARKKFQEAVELAEKWQEELAEIFDISKVKTFAKKKKLTSLFRRLAPLGLATTIMFTANIRALRHVIAMRTVPHAETEIRHVFSTVAEICKQDYPNFFQDMTLQEDGLTWEMEHWKV